MSFHGSALSYPFRADQRGTLATVSNRRDIVRESITAIVRTRQGERVMLPDYGLPDFVFAVIDEGFAVRVSYHIEQQIKKYEPLAERVTVTVSSVGDEQRAAIEIQYTERGTNVPQNLVIPIREFLRT
jgi:phage baseplate assembly protein W